MGTNGNITISAEDVKLIRKFEEILKRGYYCDGGQVTEVHNRVLGTRLSPTNCSSCIRQRITALVEALNRFERLNAKVEEEKVEETPEETKPEQEDIKERMARVRAAKKSKK